MGIEFAIFSLAVGYMQQRKAQKAAREQARAQKEIQAQQRARENIKQLREARIKRAAIAAAAENQGAGGSSAAIGAESSLVSQGASNVGFGNRIGELQDEVFAAQGRQSRYQGNAAFFGQLSNFAMSDVFTDTGGSSGRGTG